MVVIAYLAFIMIAGPIFYKYTKKIIMKLDSSSKYKYDEKKTVDSDYFPTYESYYDNFKDRKKKENNTQKPDCLPKEKTKEGKEEKIMNVEKLVIDTCLNYSDRMDSVYIEVEELFIKSSQFKDIFSRMIYPMKRSYYIKTQSDNRDLRLERVFCFLVLMQVYKNPKEQNKLLNIVKYNIPDTLQIRETNHYDKYKNGTKKFDHMRIRFREDLGLLSSQLKNIKELPIFLDKVSKDLELNFPDLLAEINSMISEDNIYYDSELLEIFLRTYLESFNKYINQYYDFMLSSIPDNKSKYLERLEKYKKIQPVKFESAYKAGIDLPMTEIDIEGIVKDSVSVKIPIEVLKKSIAEAESKDKKEGQ